MAENLNNVRVLVVEDDDVFRAQVVGAVKRLNTADEIFACRCGAEVLEKIQREKVKVDLALVDLGLPDIGGIEVIRVLRRHFSDIPIMVISAIRAERVVIEAIRAGARGYILKTDSEAVIADAIADVLQGNYPISPALARALFKLAGAPEQRSEEEAEFRLSPRELETLQHIARGNSYNATAALMGVALSTVQTNIRNLYRKLDVTSQVQAINKARETGLI